MAKVSSIEKNNRRKRMVEAKKASRKALKEIIMNKEATFEERLAATRKLAEMPRNSAAVRVRNRCELTGRSRGVYRYFKLSRIMLRKLGNEGTIPGVVKASW